MLDSFCISVLLIHIMSISGHIHITAICTAPYKNYVHAYNTKEKGELIEDIIWPSLRTRCCKRLGVAQRTNTSSPNMSNPYCISFLRVNIMSNLI